MKANEASPPAPAPSPGPVHTALEDVRACLPLADGRVLAGSAGGVWLVGRDDARGGAGGPPPGGDAAPGPAPGDENQRGFL